MGMTYEEAVQFADTAMHGYQKRTYYAIVGKDDIAVFLNAVAVNPSTLIGTLIVTPYFFEGELREFNVEWEVLYDGDEPVDAPA